MEKLNILSLKVGSKVIFTPCEGCDGSKKAIKCYFCQPSVKPRGTVVATYPDFDIPTVEIKVIGAERLFEMTQDDLENPEIVTKVVL